VKSSSSTEFTASDGRRFAFPVGTAFALLAGILWWREHLAFAWIGGGLAAALYLAGLALPAKLGPIYRGWMAMALAISKVTTPIIMGIMYFVVLTPFGLVMRAVGKKPIRHRAENGSFWRPANPGPKDLRRQF
jgi:hypothetical protein